MRGFLVGPLLLALLALPVRPLALAQGAPTSTVLSLDQALATARTQQPRIRQAAAERDIAQAAVDRTLAPLLPQLNGTASYQRTTANFVARPGSVPSTLNRTKTAPSFDTFNFYNFGATASQLLYDFGQARGNYRAAKESAHAEEDEQRVTERTVELQVRTAFFEARAQRALVAVAAENLANQERHLQQVQAFVTVGTRPEIELAQVRTDVANARVQHIQAENAYEISKAKLNQAMGVEGVTSYDVADDTLPPLPEEEQELESLVRTAFESRAELASLQGRARGQRLIVRSAKGSYGPTVTASTSVTEAGLALNDLTWNWNAGVFVVWPLLEGGTTRAQVREARATHDSLVAQLDALRQQVRFEIEQARLGVRAAKAVVEAAAEAEVNARERLKLAEGRYAAGVGNVIELGDAQLALASAEAQQVSAEYDLSSARALLLNALGKSK